MDEITRAQKVWRNAQAAVVTTSARLTEPMDDDERAVAVEDYKQAVEDCTAAKAFFDAARAGQQAALKCQPRAG